MLLAHSYCFPLCLAGIAFCTLAVHKHGLPWFARLKLSSPQTSLSQLSGIAQGLNFPHPRRWRRQ